MPQILKSGARVRWTDAAGKEHVGVVTPVDAPTFMQSEGWTYVVEMVTVQVPHWLRPGTKIVAEESSP